VYKDNESLSMSNQLLDHNANSNSQSAVNFPESKQFLQRIKQKVETKSRSKDYLGAAEVAVLRQFFYNKLEGRVLLPLGSYKNHRESLYNQEFSDIDLSEEEDSREGVAPGQ